MITTEEKLDNYIKLTGHVLDDIHKTINHQGEFNNQCTEAFRTILDQMEKIGPVLKDLDRRVKELEGKKRGGDGGETMNAS